jgi:hemolysin activation/secretion protein
MNRSLWILLGCLSPIGCPSSSLAQLAPQIIPRDQPPSAQPRPPEQLPPPLRPPVPLTPPLLPLPDRVPDAPLLFRVRRFKVVGSSVFSPAEIDAVTQPWLNRDITFADVLQARIAITELYAKQGYITSGAVIPEQEFGSGDEVIISVIEGSLDRINITGTRRLNPGYIRSRLAIATAPPLQQQRLLAALQLLRLNPLIANLSAELASSRHPGQSTLNVTVQEAPTVHSQIGFDNGRVPSVGTDRRRIELQEDNLLGLGDSIRAGYANTKGSNSIDLGYTIPISPHNTALSFNYGSANSSVIEQPFDILEIESRSRYYELTLTQPLQQTPTSDVAIGLTFSRRESETRLGIDDIGPFPLSPGADDQGRTRLAALRFFQTWTQRSPTAVLALRSQFSVGLNAFGATVNADAPDTRFVTWRGQAQWVRLLGTDPDALLLLRADAQFADRPLLSMEQFGIGGLDSVRGYRQDALLTDSGLLAAAEVRLPIVRIPQWDSTIALTPFLELGHGWNRGRPDSNTLLSVGMGLRWRLGRRFLARFDWGIPLISAKSSKATLQEQGLYFSVLWNPF